MAIELDQEECMGCGSCAEICPDAFDFDEDTELASVKDPDCDADCVEEAIDACPAECITK